MLETFAQTKVGDGPDNVISDDQWGLVESVCLRGVSGITRFEESVAQAFGILGWVFVSTFALYVFTELAVSNRSIFPTRRSLLPSSPSEGEDEIKRFGGCLPIILVVFVTTITIGHLWAFKIYQGLQIQVAEQSGNADSDGNWTFGQIVATLLLAPLIADALHLKISRGDIEEYSEDSDDSGGSIGSNGSD